MTAPTGGHHEALLVLFDQVNDSLILGNLFGKLPLAIPHCDRLVRVVEEEDLHYAGLVADARYMERGAVTGTHQVRIRFLALQQEVNDLHEVELDCQMQRSHLTVHREAVRVDLGVKEEVGDYLLVPLHDRQVEVGLRVPHVAVHVQQRVAVCPELLNMILAENVNELKELIMSHKL